MDVRLKKEKDFKKVFEKGKRFYSGSLTAYLIKSEEPAFGVSVGKRHGKSVVRNRIKRLVREAYRAAAKKYETPFTVVFVPKVKEEYSLADFVSDVEYVFRKAGATEKGADGSAPTAREDSDGETDGAR